TRCRQMPINRTSRENHKTRQLFGLAFSQWNLGLSPVEPSEIAGGTQDNATERREQGTNWTFIGAGGDGFHAAYDAGSTRGAPIIYFNERWGSSGILRYPNSGIGGDGDFFADPLRRSTVVRISAGQLYRSGNAAAGSPAQWSCIDPTPTDTSDAVTS